MNSLKLLPGLLYEAQGLKPLKNERRVQFADWCGKELVSTKHITPNNSAENLFALQQAATEKRTSILLRYLKCSFTPLGQGSESVIAKILKKRKVCLDNVICLQYVVLGLVQVINMAYEKVIIVRFTTNRWKSYRDIWADYVSSTSDKSVDKFTFRISLCAWMFDEGNDGLEFAICYRVNGEEHWDSNNGRNYRIDCCRAEIRAVSRIRIETSNRLNLEC